MLTSVSVQAAALQLSHALSQKEEPTDNFVNLIARDDESQECLNSFRSYSLSSGLRQQMVSQA